MLFLVPSEAELMGASHARQPCPIVWPPLGPQPFHQLCATLWNAPDVVTAMVKIVDENLDNAEGYRDFITHEQEQTNEPE